MAASLPLDRAKKRTGLVMAGLVAAMVALGFASVPLYRMFCQATGWNGTVQERLNAVAPGPVVGRFVNVRFDANVSPSLPWGFEPDQTVTVRLVPPRAGRFVFACDIFCGDDHEDMQGIIVVTE